MSREMELNLMPVADLAQKCAQETQSYLQQQRHETGYCFELFRRAVVQRDDDAWHALYAQYRPQVERWVYRHPDFALLDDEAQDYTNQAFARFSKSFTHEKFSQSKSLAGVLSYLQACVHGAVTDAWRKLRHLQIEQESQDEEQEAAEQDPTPEEVLQNAQTWELIKRKAKDPKEYIVIYALYYLSFSPREILAEYPGTFKDIKEIYQLRVNFLERLERDEEIKKFFRRR